MTSYNGFTPAQRNAGDRMLKAAVAAGIIPPAKTQKCCLCGQAHGLAGGIMHYHNEDYTPANVVADARPMCFICHMMLHRRFRAPKSWEAFKAGVRDGTVQTVPVPRVNWSLLDDYTKPEERFNKAK